jgi:hypothetical protein
VDLADLVPAKFLIGMMLLNVLISAGEIVYLRGGTVEFGFGKCSTLGGEILHLTGGNRVFGQGKLWIEEKKRDFGRKCVDI